MRLLAASAGVLLVLLLLAVPRDDEKLARHRNLGKAFYENPTTQKQAVEEFRKALDLAPDSTSERVNYGLALLRAGMTEEGMRELQAAQKQDPKIPHTWFNLGIQYKRNGDTDAAIAQFEQMIRLVPHDAIAHYNLGSLAKLAGNDERAIGHFQQAARLDHNLAAPHFQLFNMYRRAERDEDAARERVLFEEARKRREGSPIPEDLEWSMYAEVIEDITPETELAPAARPDFRERIVARGLDSGSGLLAFDYDADGIPDVLVWSGKATRLFRGGLHQVGETQGAHSAAAGDIDNDGLPEVCLVTSSGALLTNNKLDSPRQLAAGRFVKAVFLDYDHDYDLDLLLFGKKSLLLRNQGPAGWMDLTETYPFQPGTPADATAIDLVADGMGFDIVASYVDGPTFVYRDRLGGRYEAVLAPAIPTGARRLWAADFDRDGWTDLEFETASFGRSRNNNGTFLEAPPPPAPGFAARLWAEADFNADGQPDYAAIFPDGSLRMLENSAAASRSWISVRLTGVKNLKLAAGARVEVRADRFYQKQIYRGIPLLFLVGTRTEADSVRITWPNGLIQNETRQPLGRPAHYRELPRLSGSCPMIFSWNGRAFEFITDVLGVAPLGASAGDGTYFPTDHDEYVQIPAASLAPEGGVYRLRVTEELREVSYLDRIELVAVDHPAAYEVVTNDKFKAPPYPEFRLFGVSRRIAPTGARDELGRSVLPRLLHRDSSYAGTFERDLSGVARLHSLTLDFAGSAPLHRPALFLNGWVDWADGSTFVRASQESKEGLILPYLQVKDSTGAWRTVVPDMGLPAGKPKTIAVDLTGKFLSESRQVRIVTNLCIYWDDIFLGEASTPPTRLTRLTASSAALRFRGWSKPVIDPERRRPERFDYATVLGASMWNPIPGNYTRYGDVRPLLESTDDRMVLMGSGDELALEFETRSLPPLPVGWKRDYLLYVDGWAKDGDANTAFSQSVEPLPFHGMTSYPYGPGESYPDSAAGRAWRKEWNIRPALRIIRPLAR
jgi:hypothetical protein